jgi:small subunit ribosomal protein S3
VGQKIHPGGLRVGIIHDWKSNWYTGTKEFPAYIIEDVRIRDHINGKLGHAGLSDILIRKDKQRITIDIFTARPGIVIGKSGSEVDALRREIHAMTEKNVHININEIKRPELDARLVAQSIAEQLENRVSFRRAMKRSLASAMRSGAQGVKVQCGGRLGGTEMSRSEHYSEGRVPLHTLRADIDYGFAEAKTTFGRIGVKVWINKGEIMPEGYGDGRDGESTRRRPALEGLSAGREGGRRAPDREGLGPVRRRERSGGGGGRRGGRGQGGGGQPRRERPQQETPPAPEAEAPETTTPEVTEAPPVETPVETPAAEVAAPEAPAEVEAPVEATPPRPDTRVEQPAATEAVPEPPAEEPAPVAAEETPAPTPAARKPAAKKPAAAKPAAKKPAAKKPAAKKPPAAAKTTAATKPAAKKPAAKTAAAKKPAAKKPAAKKTTAAKKPAAKKETK